MSVIHTQNEEGSTTGGAGNGRNSTNGKTIKGEIRNSHSGYVI
ncbi:MAG: hypothetical protein WBZ36_30450 [Candidatus Nitrosopolaris sp.]